MCKKALVNLNYSNVNLDPVFTQWTSFSGLLFLLSHKDWESAVRALRPRRIVLQRAQRLQGRIGVDQKEISCFGDTGRRQECNWAEPTGPLKVKGLWDEQYVQNNRLFGDCLSKEKHARWVGDDHISHFSEQWICTRRNTFCLAQGFTWVSSAFLGLWGSREYLNQHNVLSKHRPVLVISAHHVHQRLREILGDSLQWIWPKEGISQLSKTIRILKYISI